MPQEVCRRPWYVYFHAYPDGRKFYIGKGTGSRLFAHEVEARTGCECEKCQVIRGIWADGGFVLKGIVFETFDEAMALQREKDEIAENISPWLVNVRLMLAPERKSVVRRMYVAVPSLPGLAPVDAAEHCDLRYCHFSHYGTQFGLTADSNGRYQLEDLATFRTWMNTHYPRVGWHNEDGWYDPG